VDLDTRRYGKAVTVVRGLESRPDEAEKLARELKKGLATGGSGKDGLIVLQGDRRKDVMRLLQQKGYTVR
jgi:translation initiation factor 1